MKIARLSPLPSQNKPMPTLELVQRLSAIKQEPSWMLAKRLQGLTAFQKLPLPSFGASLAKLNFEEIEYYQNAGIKEQSSWESVPASIKKTFEKLGIPQAEREYLAGVKSQYESEVIYGSLKQDLVKQGVIFLSMDEAVKKQPDLVKQYFGTIVSYDDNKFSALNTAVWSGGSFIYVPQGVCLKLPLQAYFRINSPYSGQFERTLIILEEGASLHYIEGCSAPVYSQNSLHSGVVEILVKKNASCQYSTIQNWSKNVYNLVTKRAYVEEDANMVWVDGNIGSKITMKYPACYLVGKRAHGELLSLSLAGTNQIQDTGGSMIHRAQETTSLVIAKSIAQKGGTASFRGWVNIKKQAKKNPI